ncbi:hypothetical protein [Subtercola boreus]|nr:hypothetical protein [Subtercola boreus]
MHEDAFLGTLLDVADAEHRGTPTRDECTSIMVHGVAARLDRLVVPEIRNAGSTIALTAGTGIAVTEFVISSWAPWLAGNPAPGSLTQIGPFYDTGFVFAGLWMIALIAALSGRWAVGRVVLVLSIAAAIPMPFLYRLTPGIWPVDNATLVLLVGFALVAIVGRPRRGVFTGGAFVGWGLLAALAYCTPSFPYGQWASSRSLWSGVGMFWYGALVLLATAVGFALTRRWNTAFTIVLSLTPLAVTFAANEIQGIVIQNGTAAAITIPVGIGVLLLFLYSSGRLILPTRTRRRSLFKSVR